MINRIFYSDNGSLTDYSVELNKYGSGEQTIANFVAAEDYLYVGAWAPFNHLFFKFGATKNTNSVTTSVEYWAGNSWHSVVEIQDETNGWQQDGYITWVPDRNQNWTSNDTSGSGGTITGLSTITVYNRYWVRFKFSGDLSAGVVLSWLGQLFCLEEDITTEYPDLTRSNVYTAFSVSNWEAQRVRASEILVKDLIQRKIITFEEQILEKEDFKLACVPKVAQIIFTAFGDDYRDNRLEAEIEYKKRIDKSVFKVDRTNDGILNRHEVGSRTGFMSR